jgi:GGDEF domain-containing protein
MFSSRSQAGKQNTPAPRSFRLPKQSVVPNYTDIQFLAQEANKQSGRQVELPFSVTEGSQEFVVAVKVDHNVSLDPIWTLTAVTSSGHQVIFQHPEPDLSMVTNLVMSGCGCDLFSDNLASEAMMGRDTLSNLNPIGTGSAEVPVVNQTGSQHTHTQETNAVFDAPKPGVKATLEGDLTKMQAPNLLQSLNMAKMTGRLDVKDKNESARVYFDNGTAVHAEMKDAIGDEALIELVTWTAGEFRFWPDETTAQKTVKKRLDAMLMEGVTLLDQNQYLESAGLKLESCLVKRNAIISEQEFTARLQKGAPIGLQGQIDFYELIDNHSQFFDILAKRPMRKTEYVPILFNLISCGLVQVTDQQARSAGRGLGIDEGTLQSVNKALIRQETDILTYPAFLYFLQQEYLRYEYFNFPFSLIVFSLGHRKGGANGPVEALQMLAVKRAMQRISLVKRPIDMLGHYETFDFGLILPNSNAKAAGALAHRIVDVLREAPLTADMDPRGMVFAFGVAGVPEDSQELDKLLAAAKGARDLSKSTQRIVLAREMASG